LIQRLRSSTAPSSDDCVHRRSSWFAWGRADLQGSADRPFNPRLRGGRLYYAHVTKRDDPEKLSARARRDMALEPEIVRVFKANFEVYGVKKI
jgi:hypothetical protein